jgi:hypothetical protein
VGWLLGGADDSVLRHDYSLTLLIRSVMHNEICGEALQRAKC